MVRGMPANILNADVMFPSFRDDETSEQKLDKVTNYLYMLLEQLRYSLSNLDADNFNDTGLREIAEGISRPLQTEFENELVKTAALIEGFSNEFGSQITALTQWKSGAEQSIASVTQKANANGADITALTQWKSGAEQSIASVTQKANANGADITSLLNWKNTANSEISGLKSTTASIKATADSAGAKISQVVQAVGKNGEVNAASIVAAVNAAGSNIKIDADHVNVSGFVTFESLKDNGGSYINGNNIGLVSDYEGDSTASLRFWLDDDIEADEDGYLIGEIYTSGTNGYLEDCTLRIRTRTSNMKITSGGDLDMSSALGMTIESGTSYVEIIADGSVEIISGNDTIVDCDYMTIIPALSGKSSRYVDYAWQFFDDGIYYNGYKMVSTPS